MLGATGWALVRTLRHPRSLRLAAQSQVNRLLHHPLEGVLPLIVPLITAAISHLRKPATTSE
jgi:hypothetical protein